MTVRLRTIGIIILLGFVLMIGGAALFVYAGIYNVAASRQHTQPVYQLLEYAMRRAVKVRSDDIAVPDLNSTLRIRNGAVHYQEHCVQCHGAPGVAPNTLAYGMTPEPVNLVSTARDWTPAEIFWVVKHGIKMSGMPAWAYRLSDEEMWDIVAFVEAMVAMSPEDYQALSNEIGKAHADQIGKADAHSSARQRPETQSTMAPPGPPPAAASDPKPLSSPLLGDVQAGRRATAQYLCATCHVIPGIVGASRHVGPPLKGIANRRYIAGILINNPENMVQWLRNPQQFAPSSAMPNLGVTEKDARDIAAYLYTLEDLD